MTQSGMRSASERRSLKKAENGLSPGAVSSLSGLFQGHCHRAITAEAEPRLSKMQSLQPLCTTSTDLWCRGGRPKRER